MVQLHPAPAGEGLGFAKNNGETIFRNQSARFIGNSIAYSYFTSQDDGAGLFSRSYEFFFTSN